MKRIRIVGLCLVAAFALSAIAVSTASATAPEFGRCLKKAKAEGSGFSDSKCNKAIGTGAKYEWTTTIVKKGLSSVIKSGTTATLETVSKTKITCKGETATGEVDAPKDAKLTADFTGCESGRPEMPVRGDHR